MRVFSHASQRCIDLVGGKAAPGAALMIWDCSGSASQRWTFPSDGTMRALGLCAEVADGSTADGADLRMASCDGGAAQRITLNVRHDLAASQANKCLDVRDNLTSNGTRIQLWSCNGHDNQKWSTS
ncbi:ricin-type beta-trefoil lectin domain protein [Streptomyces vietnamensis]|uniref:ricin-type beta-trefoil lectin domain protein n=1 Tax=Streptomyces vietnamensis TaxID=362257 RepID=UPI00378A9348